MKPTRTALGAVFALCAVTLVLASCQILIGIDDEKGAPTPAATIPPDPCVHARPLARGGDASSASLPDLKTTFFFATRTFTVRPPGQPLIGYDLDGYCTGDDASTTRDASCVQPNGTDLVDEDGGVDNAFAEALGTLAVATDIAAERLNKDVRNGGFALIVQLSNYNGTADDPDVNVALLTASGLSCGGCDASVDMPHPAWDGGDRWNLVKGTNAFVVEDAGFVGADTFRAFVRNGTLVMTGSGMLTFALAESTLSLAEPILTADIRPLSTGAGMRLVNGVISGRASVDQVLLFTDRTDINDIPACVSGLNKVFTAKVCAARDLRFDGGDPNAPCDALSLGFGFEAEPALLSGDIDGGITTNCSDAGSRCP